MKQRKWTANEKLDIVLEGLKEKRSVAEICREHNKGYKGLSGIRQSSPMKWMGEVRIKERVLCRIE